ncbi:alpha/beta fold hydrolase [Deltaproteobacteria bacterium TL4]
MNEQKSTSWFQNPKPKPKAPIRMFLFNSAGLGAVSFFSMVNALPSHFDIFVAQLPGRENRFSEPPYLHLSNLIDDLGEVIIPLCDRPFLFFGHSMGALISFELTRYLRRRNHVLPLQLLVAAHRAPHLPRGFPPLHNLSEKQLWEELRLLGGTPKEVLANAELMQMITPTIRSDFQVCERYRYMNEPILDCRISAFAGKEDARVRPAEIEAWQEHSTKKVNFYVFPGGHFFHKENFESFHEKLLLELAEYATPSHL